MEATKTNLSGEIQPGLLEEPWQVVADYMRGGTRQPHTQSRTEMRNAFPNLGFSSSITNHTVSLLTGFDLSRIQVCQMDSGFNPS